MIFDIERLQKQLDDFVKERDWVKYQTPKNLSMAIVREATELMECYMWQTDNKILISKVQMEEIKDEVADIFIFLIYFCSVQKINLVEVTEAKIEKNKTREWDFDK